MVRSMSSGETGVGKSDEDWERCPPRIGRAGGSRGIVVVVLEGMVVVQRHFGSTKERIGGGFPCASFRRLPDRVSSPSSTKPMPGVKNLRPNSDSINLLFSLENAPPTKPCVAKTEDVKSA